MITYIVFKDKFNIVTATQNETVANALLDKLKRNPINSEAHIETYNDIGVELISSKCWFVQFDRDGLVTEVEDVSNNIDAYLDICNVETTTDEELFFINVLADTSRDAIEIARYLVFDNKESNDNQTQSKEYVTKPQIIVTPEDAMGDKPITIVIKDSAGLIYDISFDNLKEFNICNDSMKFNNDLRILSVMWGPYVLYSELNYSATHMTWERIYDFFKCNFGEVTYE